MSVVRLTALAAAVLLFSSIKVLAAPVSIVIETAIFANGAASVTVPITIQPTWRTITGASLKYMGDYGSSSETLAVTTNFGTFDTLSSNTAFDNLGWTAFYNDIGSDWGVHGQEAYGGGILAAMQAVRNLVGNTSTTFAFTFSQSPTVNAFTNTATRKNRALSNGFSSSLVGGRVLPSTVLKLALFGDTEENAALLDFDSPELNLTTNESLPEPIAAVPIPAALPLLATGLGAIILLSRRQRQKPVN